MQNSICRLFVWLIYEGASATTAFLQPRSDLLANSCFFFFGFFFPDPLCRGLLHILLDIFIFYVSANVM